MAHDPHEHLKHLEKMFGTDDPHTRDQYALKTFTGYSWHERESIIAQTDAAIGADDDASLRQRSQLMDFSRKLKTANALLRRVGR